MCIREMPGVTGVVLGHGKRQENWQVFRDGAGPTPRPSAAHLCCQQSGWGRRLLCRQGWGLPLLDPSSSSRKQQLGRLLGAQITSRQREEGSQGGRAAAWSSLLEVSLTSCSRSVPASGVTAGPLGLPQAQARPPPHGLHRRSLRRAALLAVPRLSRPGPHSATCTPAPSGETARICCPLCCLPGQHSREGPEMTKPLSVCPKLSLSAGRNSPQWLLKLFCDSSLAIKSASFQFPL